MAPSFLMNYKVSPLLLKIVANTTMTYFLHHFLLKILERHAFHSTSFCFVMCKVYLVTVNICKHNSSDPVTCLTLTM